MSILNSIYYNLTSMIFPSECVGCSTIMGGRSEWICQRCRAMMSTTNFHLTHNNPMLEMLHRFNPNIHSAAAQFYFVHEGLWRSVIHEMKYHRSWRTAYKMGFWYGSELLESPQFTDLDMVIPIPLHPSRKISRGYNQSEKIAQGAAKAMKIPMRADIIRRCRNNPTQVSQSSSERWENVDNIFEVKKCEALHAKKILIVDDVLTTGATMISAIESILKVAPTCRISVATLSITHKSVDNNIY